MTDLYDHPVYRRLGNHMDLLPGIARELEQRSLWGEPVSPAHAKALAYQIRRTVEGLVDEMLKICQELEDEERTVVSTKEHSK